MHYQASCEIVTEIMSWKNRFAAKTQSAANQQKEVHFRASLWPGQGDFVFGKILNEK